MNHFVRITCNGQLIYDISDVEQVPSMGHQIDLREAEVPVPGLYTVMDVT